MRGGTLKRMAKTTLWLLLGALALPGSAQISVGVLVEDATRFEPYLAAAAQAGLRVSLERFSESALQQQVLTLAALGRARVELAQVLTKWLPQAQGSLLDLTPYARDLEAAGVALYAHGNALVGVKLPWRDDAFLAILARARNVPQALEFLKLFRAQAPGVTPLALSIGPLVVAKPPKKHAGVDGALEGFLGVLRQAVPQGLVTALAHVPAQAQDALRRVAEMWGIPLSPDGAAVTVVLEPLQPLSPVALGAREAEASPLGLQKAVVPLDQLESFLAQVAGRARVRLPFEPVPLAATSEGVPLVGAAAFHARGIRGAGVKIAVVDVGFAGYTASQARGDLPYGLVTRDFTGTGMDTGLTHGTAVAEIVYDIAPAATLYLLKIANEVDLDNAVTYCITEGVHVLVHSLGWFNTSFYDGTGTIAQIVNRAAGAGILWVQAAGNFGLRHFGPLFTDANQDGWHDTDVTLSVGAGERVLLYLTWESWPATADDYDLYLFDPAGNLLASSTKTQAGAEQPTERIFALASVPGTYRVRIQRVAGAARRLALFSVYHNLVPYEAASSLVTPADVEAALSVAAIGWQSYAAGPAQPYSSRGPTKDGRRKPDLSGPDNVTTGVSAYNPFPGTSAAAPHVAGVAALLKAENPGLSVGELRARLLSFCVPMGDPYAYGAGRLEARPQPLAQPDLVVDSITYTPSTPAVGATVGFTVVVRNQGNAAAGAFTVRLQGAGPAQDRSVSALAAGASTTLSFSLPLSASPETFTATVDALNQVAEGDEGNNTKQVTITGVMPAPQGQLSTDKSVYVQGETVQIVFRNTGSVTIELPNAAPWVVKDGAGRTVFAPLAAQVLTPVNPGETRTWSWNGRDNAGNLAPPGSYTVELSTLNAGTFRATFTLQAPALPDLVVDSLTYTPTAPTLGTALTFTVVVRNQGNAPAGAFTVRLQGAGPAQDRNVSALAAGASTTLSFSLPLSTSPETFTATVDALNQVAEASEGNNTRQVTVTAVQPALPDLVVESVTYAPPSPTVGTTLTFTITVRNQGGASAGLFYIELRGQAGSQYASVSALPAGSRVTVSLQLPLSASPETFTITADATRRVAESDETNNTYQVTVTAVQPPLSLTLQTDKPNYTVGEAVRITVNVSRASHVYLVELDPQGRAKLLFPNYWERDPRLPAGATVLPRLTTYQIRAGEPTGVSRIFAFAADRAIPLFPTSFPSPTFPILSPNGQAFLSQVRGWLSANVPTGNWAEASVQVTVQPLANQPPVASFTFAPAEPLVNQWITFDATASRDPDGTIVSYRWDFGDGATATGARVTKRYTAPGTYTVTLTVTDNQGASSSTSQRVTVRRPNQPPVASFTFTPANPNPGETVTFDASASSDPDGTLVSYAWNFGDGTTGSGV
ncbi:MAG: CARDB domain-containing protein, partial [Candidatus Bipolaricaulaceae bacterium]